jgi:hypothetical protein
MLEKELVLAGRNFLYFGCFAAFGFVGLVAMLFLFLKRSHKRLRKKFAETSDHEYDSKEVVLGRYFLATWRDRLNYRMVSDDAY